MDNKVPQQINDFIGDNVKKLAQLFPSAVKDGEVDFEALKEELGQFEEVGSEKYELTWAGKKNAKKIAQEDVIGRTLKFIPEDSKNADITENLYIEGDNLEVLKLLRQNYYGAIKMIYIDPPYNTGNDFVYNDSFEMDRQESNIAEGIQASNGEKFTVNNKSQNRFHAKWLNNIYIRLKIARELLTDDGVIFISIDDNELENLILIGKEVFGENNYESCISWRRRTNQPNDKAKMIAKVAENIIVFSKNSEFLSTSKSFHGVPLTENRRSEYKNPDNDINGPWSTNPWKAAVGRGGTEYSIITPTGKVYTEVWYGTEETFKDLQKKGRVYWTDNGNGYPRIKIYLKDAEKEGQAAINFMTPERYGSNQEGSSELEKLFGIKGMFDNPKPTKLICALLGLVTNDDSIVLDFFSGTSTAADAVMQLNLKDGGKRKFIMVQWPEKCSVTSIPFNNGYNTICEIGKERIRRAGDKIKSEHPETDIDIGFKVFETSDTNIKWNSLIDMGQIDINQMESSPDTIDFMPGAKDVDIVYELMLRQNDVPLSSKIEKICGGGYERTYLYADSFLVCLETKITNELIDKLAEIDPLPIKFIFRDSAFQDNIALKDETFRRLKALIEKNHGMQKTTYTVEFL